MVRRQRDLTEENNRYDCGSVFDDRPSSADPVFNLTLNILCGIILPLYKRAPSGASTLSSLPMKRPPSVSVTTHRQAPLAASHQTS